MPTPADGSPAGGSTLWPSLHPEWAEALAPVTDSLVAVEAFLATERAAGRAYLPRDELVLRAFSRPMSEVRVLILGQDPYPNPGHPIGLAFAVAPDVRPIPRSLSNIYTELRDDLGHPPAAHGDLTPWFEQGVLLLNKVLTVEPGRSASHRRRGWEKVTERAVDALVQRGGPLVAILWGRDAQALVPRLGAVPYVASAHPSPLAARYGFFGSRPFSRTNALLVESGGEPVDWSL